MHRTDMPDTPQASVTAIPGIYSLMILGYWPQLATMALLRIDLNLPSRLIKASYPLQKQCACSNNTILTLKFPSATLTIKRSQIQKCTIILRALTSINLPHQFWPFLSYPRFLQSPKYQIDSLPLYPYHMRTLMSRNRQQ